MCGHIWKATVAAVEEGGEVCQCVFADVVFQIVFYGGRLILRPGEVIAKASRAGDPSDFGTDGLGSTDGSDVWTCAWELRCELGCLLAVIGLTWRSHAYNGNQ